MQQDDVSFPAAGAAAIEVEMDDLALLGDRPRRALPPGLRPADPDDEAFGPADDERRTLMAAGGGGHG